MTEDREPLPNSVTANSHSLIETIESRDTALTLQEFAELYSLSYKTAAQMVSQGRIPAVRIGSIWRLDPVLLAAWLRDDCVAQNKPARRVKLPKPRNERLALADLPKSRDLRAAPALPPVARRGRPLQGKRYRDPGI